MKKKLPPHHETVYKISEADIKATAKTQCKMADHKWLKETDTTVICELCRTGLILPKHKMKDYGC